MEYVRPGLTTPARILALEGSDRREVIDELATEEPLEIRLAAGASLASLAVTMRTPGHDFELAAGFALSEGIVASRAEIATIAYCTDAQIDSAQRYNIVTLRLAASQLPPMERFERHFTIGSACGVCGKTSIESLRTRAAPIQDDLQLDAGFVAGLPRKMRDAQRVFASTGGLHAAALFDSSGRLLALREDVGRHNALDKIVGWALMQDRVPLRGCALLVSGRASYQLVQKSAVAAIPVLCAVSAPSSLAMQLAQAFGITLVGFVRGERANVYSGFERIS